MPNIWLPIIVNTDPQAEKRRVAEVVKRHRGSLKELYFDVAKGQAYALVTIESPIDPAQIRAMTVELKSPGSTVLLTAPELQRATKAQPPA